MAASPNRQIVDVGDAPESIVAADLDGDGRLDLVTVNSGSSFSDGDSVSILLGTATATSGRRRTSQP